MGGSDAHSGRAFRGGAGQGARGNAGAVEVLKRSPSLNNVRWVVVVVHPCSLLSSSSLSSPLYRLNTHSSQPQSARTSCNCHSGA